MAEYNPSELMTVNAARLLRDRDVVLVGVGLPNLACNLARRTHAPNLVMIYEAGVIGAQPARLPLSIGDPTLVSGAIGVCTFYELFSFFLQRGYINVGFMGGAQIDRLGNVNATVIGNYAKPKVRLPGSGGAVEIAAWADRCYFITPHEKRRFPPKVDFVTSAGYIGPRAQRVQAGGRGGGPAAVVTHLGIMEPDDAGELVLAALHPGCTVEAAQANTGWPLRAAASVRATEPPSALELRILREQLDPQRIYLS